MSRPRDWHPLRSSDPVGGDVGDVQRLARRYADTAEAINAAAAALREIHGSATAWNSEAGRVFRERTIEVADTIKKAHDRYAKTADALDTYAKALDDIQADADAVLARARQAEVDRAAAEQARARMAGQPEPDLVADSRLAEDADLAAGRIRAADEQLTAIETRWRTAGNTAADAIDEINNNKKDKLKDGIWDNFLDLVETITKWAGALSAVLGLLSALCGLVGLAPLAALLAAGALVVGLISLAGNTLLLSQGRASLGEVLMDVAGVLTFGAGRAFLMAARSLKLGARGLGKPALIRSLRAEGKSQRQAERIARERGVTGGGRQAKANADRATSNSGVRPTGSEFRSAYRPSAFYKPVDESVTPVFPGTRHLPEVDAAMRRARGAELRGSASEATGAGLDVYQLATLRDSPSGPPVVRDR